MVKIKNELIEYVRNDKGNPIGVVVASLTNDKKIGIGWSKVNIKAGDVYKKERALQIARDRINKGIGHLVIIPFAVRPIFKKMVNRSEKYFRKPHNISTVDQSIMCEI